MGRSCSGDRHESIVPETTDTLTCPNRSVENYYRTEVHIARREGPDARAAVGATVALLVVLGGFLALFTALNLE